MEVWVWVARDLGPDFGATLHPFPHIICLMPPITHFVGVFSPIAVFYFLWRLQDVLAFDHAFFTQIFPANNCFNYWILISCEIQFVTPFYFNLKFFQLSLDCCYVPCFANSRHVIWHIIWKLVGSLVHHAYWWRMCCAMQLPVITLYNLKYSLDYFLWTWDLLWFPVKLVSISFKVCCAPPPNPQISENQYGFCFFHLQFEIFTGLFNVNLNNFLWSFWTGLAY